MKFQKNKMIIQNERGVALLIAMMMLIMLTLIGIAAIMTSTTDINIAGNVKNSTNALFQAESGVEEVKMRMSPNVAFAFTGVDTFPWNASWGKYVLTPGKSATADPDYGSCCSTYAVVTSVQGSANWDWVKISHLTSGGSVVCYRPDITSGPTPYQGLCRNANDLPIENVTALVNSKGTTKKIQVQLRPVVSPTWGNAGVGLTNISLSGTVLTASYTSTLGGVPPTPPGSPSCSSAGGSIQTNGSGTGVISVTGTNARVCGTATVGVGGSASSVSAPAGTITGGTPPGTPVIAKSNLPTSNPTIPSPCTAFDPATFTQNQVNKVTANASNCYYQTGSSDWKLNGTTSVYFPQGAQVYLTNEVKIDGSGVLGSYDPTLAGTPITNIPGNLLLYGTNNGQELEVEGNGKLFGAVYAPSWEIELEGNGIVYGALYGNTLEMEGNGTIFYDTRLQNIGNVASYTNYSWNQVQ